MCRRGLKSLVSNLFDMQFIINNWETLLFAFLALTKIIVNLTPTRKDNKVFAKIDHLINSVVPNLKTGGGRHENS